jgi:hypothetical protein
MSNGKHDALQAEAYQWANNTFPQIRGFMFAARSEVFKYPGETEKQFLARLAHLKKIGHKKGILDLHLDMPATNIRPGAPYEFDAKVRPDYLKPEQNARIDRLRTCGGNGWAFFSFEEFQRIFTDVMRWHFGETLVMSDQIAPEDMAKLMQPLEAIREAKKKLIAEIRKKALE